MTYSSPPSHAHAALRQIIAEKALLVLSKLHAEFPSIVPEQLSAAKLAKFLVLVARDSNWVQSQASTKHARAHTHAQPRKSSDMVMIDDEIGTPPT